MESNDAATETTEEARKLSPEDYEQEGSADDGLDEFFLPLPRPLLMFSTV